MKILTAKYTMYELPRAGGTYLCQYKVGPKLGEWTYLCQIPPTQVYTGNAYTGADLALVTVITVGSAPLCATWAAAVAPCMREFGAGSCAAT